MSITSSEGIFSKALEAQAEHLLSQIPKQDKVILLNHYPFFSQESPKRALKRGENLESLIRHHPNICLYLHGHTHRHSIANLQPDGLPIVLDSGSSCLKRGGSWNLIDLNENGCMVTPYFFSNSWEEQKPHEFVWQAT
jgi:3',5'-cyclic AMP phosphodiesterase CpdA